MTLWRVLVDCGILWEEVNINQPEDGLPFKIQVLTRDEHDPPHAVIRVPQGKSKNGKIIGEFIITGRRPRKHTDIISNKIKKYGELPVDIKKAIVEWAWKSSFGWRFMIATWNANQLQQVVYEED
jgi:hypothetical protein